MMMQLIHLIAVLTAVYAREETNQCMAYPSRVNIFTNSSNTKTSNFLIAGMFPMFNGMKINVQSIIFTEALAYHVKRINTELAPNKKVGLTIYDTSCQLKSSSRQIIDLLLNQKELEEFSNFTILSVIISMNNKQLIDIANFLLPNMVPTLIAPEYQALDKDYEETFFSPDIDYPTVYLHKRTDWPKVSNMVYVLRKLKLSYITIISDNTNYGKQSRDYLLARLKKRNIIIADAVDAPSSEESNEDLIRNINFDKNMQVIILWTSKSRTAVRLLTSAHKMNVTNRIWMISTEIDLSKLPAELIQSNLILFTEVKYNLSNTNNKFIDIYLNSPYKTNVWLKYYVENVLNKTHNITAIKDIECELQPQNILKDVDALINSTANTLLEALRNIPSTDHNKLLTSKSYEDKIISPLRRTRARISLQKIIKMNGSLHSKGITEQDFNSFVSVCSGKCGRGYEPFYFNEKVKSCWQCKKCSTRYYQNNLTNNQCMMCPRNTSSNKNRTQCIPFSKVYKPITTTEKHVIYIFSTIGVLTCLFTTLIFCKFRKTPVVRASDANKTIIQLSSHTLLFLMLYTFLLEQHESICLLQPTVTGFFLVVTASITFVKTRRLLRIFQLTIRISHSDVKIMKVLSISLIVLLILVQILLAFISYLYFADSQKIQRDYENIIEHVECDNQNYFMVQFLYVKLVSLMCLWQAFKARKLPENFNETKFIGMAVLVSEIFLLAYIVKRERDITTNVILLFCSNISLTIIMYGYRLFILLFKPEKNDVKLFQQKRMKRIRQDINSTFRYEMTTESTETTECHEKHRKSCV